MLTEVPPVPRPLRLLVLMVCVAVLLSAVLLAALAAGAPLLAKDQKPSWALFGFEIVTAVAAVLGIAFGRGRYSEAPGLAVACIAGTILVAAGLGWQGSGRQLLGVSLTPVLAGRTLAALVVGGAGAWCVLSRDRRSIGLAVLGAILLAPVIGVAGVMMRPAGQTLLNKLSAAGPGVQFMAAVGGFAIAAGLLSAGTHLLIRAFELGRPTSKKA